MKNGGNGGNGSGGNVCSEYDRKCVTERFREIPILYSVRSWKSLVVTIIPTLSHSLSLFFVMRLLLASPDLVDDE